MENTRSLNPVGAISDRWQDLKYTHCVFATATRSRFYKHRGKEEEEEGEKEEEFRSFPTWMFIRRLVPLQ